LAHHVARSDGTDQAFPMKKLCRVARNLCHAGYGLAISIVTITRCDGELVVITGCRPWRSRHAGHGARDTPAIALATLRHYHAHPRAS
jgi:hypothetical protein